VNASGEPVAPENGGDQGGEPLAFAVSSGDGFADAVTLAWGDPLADVYGLARIGVGTGESASALGILFSGGEVVESVAEGGAGLNGGDWGSVRAGSLSISTEEPDEAWRLRWDGVDLLFRAVSPALPLAGGGMEGHERLCRVTGTAAGQRIDCLGQRGRSWGVADWDRVALARTVCAWLDEERALVLSAIRPAKARDHAGEEVSAWLVDAGGEARPVAEPRLSTTYDGDGRQRRAGLELYLSDDDDELPRRAAGQVECGTSLELGRLRLDCAFFRWRMEGREGVGRYDVLRRA
jgi:hypothetical protein